MKIFSTRTVQQAKVAGVNGGRLKLRARSTNSTTRRPHYPRKYKQ